MAADGIAYGNRIDHFSTSKAMASVVDAILDSPTYWSRLNGMGMSFNQPTKKYTVKISRTGQGQSFKGLETLNSSASDTTIQLEFNHTGYSHPAVKILLEHMANETQGEDINLSDFIDTEAMSEVHADLGEMVFGTGAGDDFLGLEAIVDDGTNASSIGGASRTTYTNLQSTVTASGGTLSLSQMATLWDNVATGTHKPTIGVCDEATWSLYEELLSPQIRAQYTDVGYNQLSVRGRNVQRGDDALKGHAGFNALTFRGMPIIADEFATSNVLYFLNEDFVTWAGRDSVPSDFKGDIRKISLGEMTKDVHDVPWEKPSDHGWFYQEQQMMPNQAGMIGRVYVIGQVCTSNPKRHGKLTGITSV